LGFQSSDGPHIERFVWIAFLVGWTWLLLLLLLRFARLVSTVSCKALIVLLAISPAMLGFLFFFHGVGFFYGIFERMSAQSPEQTHHFDPV